MMFFNDSDDDDDWYAEAELVNQHKEALYNDDDKIDMNTLTVIVKCVVICCLFMVIGLCFIFPKTTKYAPEIIFESPHPFRLLHVQSHNNMNRVLSSRLWKRTQCYNQLYGHDYYVNFGDEIERNQTIRLLPSSLKDKMYWYRITLIYLAIQYPHLLVPSSSKIEYDWILYTDFDTVINDSLISLQWLINYYERVLQQKCFMIVQDSPHAANSGVLFFRNSEESIHFLDLWFEQAGENMDDWWNYEMGSFQETILLYIHAQNQTLYPYTKGDCWRKGNSKSPHLRNVCYRDVLNSWGLTYQERSKFGICFVREQYPYESLNNNDFFDNQQIFLHGRLLENSNVDKWFESNNNNNKNAVWNKSAPIFNVHSPCYKKTFSP